MSRRCDTNAPSWMVGTGRFFHHAWSPLDGVNIIVLQGLFQLNDGERSQTGLCAVCKWLQVNSRSQINDGMGLEKSDYLFIIITERHRFHDHLTGPKPFQNRSKPLKSDLIPTAGFLFFLTSTKGSSTHWKGVTQNASNCIVPSSVKTISWISWIFKEARKLL